MTILYLDMNIYNRPFDDQSQMRIRLEAMATMMLISLIETGLFTAVWSFVLTYENSRNPFPERRAFVEQLADVCQHTIEPNKTIKSLATNLSDQHQVRGRDALHLACAEIAGCDYVVTCDDRLVKQGERLRRQAVLTVELINPLDLLRKV